VQPEAVSGDGLERQQARSGSFEGTVYNNLSAATTLDSVHVCLTVAALVVLADRNLSWTVQAYLRTVDRQRCSSCV
jgi:hypothetical protein